MNQLGRNGATQPQLAAVGRAFASANILQPRLAEQWRPQQCRCKTSRLCSKPSKPDAADQAAVRIAVPTAAGMAAAEAQAAAAHRRRSPPHRFHPLSQQLQYRSFPDEDRTRPYRVSRRPSGLAVLYGCASYPSMSIAAKQDAKNAAADADGQIAPGPGRGGAADLARNQPASTLVPGAPPATRPSGSFGDQRRSRP